VATNQLRVTGPAVLPPPQEEVPTAAAMTMLIADASLIHLTRDIPDTGFLPFGVASPLIPARRKKLRAAPLAG
jgi:hypothetical protein